MALVSDPLTAIVISFCLLGVLLYKRVNLGITLSATALFLALLALDIQKIPSLVYETTADPFTVSIVLTTFFIMLLSQLYKETGTIDRLSQSMGRLINNPKIVLSLLPAVIGFLPVAGGALMSAPLVDSEAEKLKLKNDRKAYVNLWFRHTIFPIYPLSQVLILTAALAGTTISSIIVRQIPVVAVMVAAGYLIGFWKIPNAKSEDKRRNKNMLHSDLRMFTRSFSPILIAIVVAVGLSFTGLNLSKTGFDVLIATLIGLAVLIAIVKPSIRILAKPFTTPGIYGITLAAYGAFLLGNTMKATGISALFGTFAAGGNVDTTILLTLIPAALGILTASAAGGVYLSMPILGGIVALSAKTASLIYMSAYLGYVMSPTHLCFTFTADYFKCTLEKIYKYTIPSFIATLTATLLIYFLI